MKTKFTFCFSFFLVMLFAQKISAQWTSSGPYGGRPVRIYAADTLLYVCSQDGGIYRSTNSNATSWTYINYNGLTTGAVSDVIQTGGTMLIATSDGVFKSTDLGASWTPSNLGLMSGATPKKFIRAGARILVATDLNMSKSDDGGNSWLSIASPPPNVTCLSFDGANVFAGTMANGVYKSTDNGDTWSAFNTGLSDLYVTCIEISGGKIFAGTMTGMFYSSTSSVSWTTAATGLPTFPVNDMASSGGKVYAGTGYGVYVSPDVSPSWTAADTGYNGVVLALEFFGGKIYLGSQFDGIYKSNSLSTINWIKHNTGYNNLSAPVVYNSGSLVITATDRGLMVSRDLAASFAPANNGLTDSTNVTCITFAGSDLFVTTANDGVFKSSDTGTTWTPVNSGITTILNARRIVATGTHLVVGMDDGKVFSSLLSPVSWSLNTGTSGAFDISALVTDGSRVWMSTPSDGVYITTDYSTWTPYNTGMTTTGVTSMAVHDTCVYAGTNAGVFKSSMVAPNWTAVNTGLPSMQIESLYASDDWVVTGFKGNVYATATAGANWWPVGSMPYLPQYSDVYSISFSNSSSRVFIGTPHNSVYSCNINELPAGINEVNQPEIFSISPNPGNGNFAITLKNGQELKSIQVFAVSGQQIKTFAPTKKTGKIDLSIDLPVGVYLVNVATNHGSTSQKLIVK